MTQDEVKTALMRLRFEGRWPTMRIAEECGLASSTIRRAFDGDMSHATQVRIEQMLKRLASKKYPTREKKNKPGHKKRYMIRYLNLKHWIGALENHHGRMARYKTKPYHASRHIDSGYVCCKLDYIAKRYLLEVFGDELTKKKISLGDCYSFEQWVLRIKATLPGMHPDLVARLISRRR